jgi:hypothetical protein
MKVPPDTSAKSLYYKIEIKKEMARDILKNRVRMVKKEK